MSEVMDGASREMTRQELIDLIKHEKKTRVKYQDVVYELCNWLDEVQSRHNHRVTVDVLVAEIKNAFQTRLVRISELEAELKEERRGGMSTLDEDGVQQTISI